jgi:hypothetical protein
MWMNEKCKKIIDFLVREAERDEEIEKEVQIVESPRVQDQDDQKHEDSDDDAEADTYGQQDNKPLMPSAPRVLSIHERSS